MKKNKLLIILLIIYILLLTWIIIFKMQIDLDKIPHYQRVNLIPFEETAMDNGRIRLKEIIGNIIIFIPVGLFIGMIFKNKKFISKIWPIFSLSLTYEITQFIFKIGSSDVTDLITNTLGGIIGLVIINTFYKIFKNKEKVNKILSILALLCMIIIISLLIFLIIVN